MARMTAYRSLYGQNQLLDSQQGAGGRTDSPAPPSVSFCGSHQGRWLYLWGVVVGHFVPPAGLSCGLLEYVMSRNATTDNAHVLANPLPDFFL